MWVRLASLVVLLLLPFSEASRPPVVIAVALVGGWSLCFLAVRRSAVAAARRHPLLVLVDVLLASVVTVLVGPHSPLIVVTLSTALLIGVLLPAIFAALVTVNLVLGYLLAVIATGADSRSLVYSVVLPMTFALIAYLGNLSQRLHHQVLDEQRRSAQLAAEAAADAERSRLAREMHDSVAKTLHGVALAASALPHWIDRDPDRAAEGAVNLHQAAEQASVEARELLVGLRQEPDETPLVELLQRRLDEMRERTTITARLQTECDVDPEPRIRYQVALVVAEALDNVALHSGASHVDISLASSESCLELSVCDDGNGFQTSTVPHGHFGIRGMRERAAVVGGELEVCSTPGQGTSVRLRVPLTSRASVDVVQT